MINVDLEKLLETGAHFGHQTKRWNPKMGEFIYGVKDGVSIFDLIKTKAYIEDALKVLSDASSHGKLILFLGTKRQVQDKIREVANATGAPFVSARWLGGTLTNFSQVKRSVSKLNDMKRAREAGEYREYTKKERLLIDRDIEKLEKTVGGLNNLDRVPDMLFVIDTHKEQSAVAEAMKMNVPVMGIVDTNADPTDITWPIPMNDDAAAALEYLLDLVAQALAAPTKAEPKVKGKSTKAKKAKASK